MQFMEIDRQTESAVSDFISRTEMQRPLLKTNKSDSILIRNVLAMRFFLLNCPASCFIQIPVDVDVDKKKQF